jgi:hypothetical protein
VGGNAGGCALIIPGSGSDTCITFDAVNSAFNTALGRVGPLQHQGPILRNSVSAEIFSCKFFAPKKYKIMYLGFYKQKP